MNKMIIKFKVELKIRNSIVYVPIKMQIEKLNNIYPLLLFVCVFLWISISIVPLNIHEDGINHLLIAREIVETGKIQSHFPYYIMDIRNGEKIYYPITSPEISHILIGLFYIIGGENFVKFYSPLCGALTAIFIYFILIDLDKFVAIFCIILTIMVNSLKFMIISPLLEQHLLATTIMCIYFYYLSLKKPSYKYTVIAGIFLGISMAIKQQGLSLFATIVFYDILKSFFDIMKNRKRYNMLLIVIISFVVAFLPLYDLVVRNGTIDFVPSDHLLVPFLRPKYVANMESIIEKNRLAYYWSNYSSPLDVIKAYFYYPIYYYYSHREREMRLQESVWVFIFLITISGWIFLYKKDKLLFSFLLALFIGQIFLTYYTNTPVYAYHVIGLTTLCIFLSTGIKYIMQLTKNKFASLAILTLFLAVMINQNIFYILPYHNSEELDNIHLNSYKNLSQFIENKNIPKDAVIIGFPSAFKYYCRRDQLWLNEGGGSKIPLIFWSNNLSVSLYWLRYYNASYIFIDTYQIDAYGIDCIPSSGLLSYIDKSPYFKKIYDDNVLRLYEIVYNED